MYPSRKNPRAPGFDYRDPGPYFVTICIHQRRNLLGHVRDGIMTLAIPDTEALARLDPLEGSTSLSDVIGWFKTMTTNWYMRGVRDCDWPRYDGHLWQPSFHDRIVRSDREMDILREYIEGNPALWSEDRFDEP